VAEATCPPHPEAKPHRSHSVCARRLGSGDPPQNPHGAPRERLHQVAGRRESSRSHPGCRPSCQAPRRRRSAVEPLQADALVRGEADGVVARSDRSSVLLSWGNAIRLCSYRRINSPYRERRVPTRTRCRRLPDIDGGTAQSVRADAHGQGKEKALDLRDCMPSLLLHEWCSPVQPWHGSPAFIVSSHLASYPLVARQERITASHAGERWRAGRPLVLRTPFMVRRIVRSADDFAEDCEAYERLDRHP
jgi:hypothetical protein